MRLLLVAALLMTPACLTECDGVGAIGSMRQGDMQHGAARGSMSPPVDDGEAPPVGVQWTIPPVFEYAAYLESGADNDPIETPACRGTLCSTLALTQAVLAERPTLRTACPVGATTLPCYRLDGGDSVADTIARAELRFLHQGTGMTCLVVVETPTTAQQVFMHTGDGAGAAPGYNHWFFSSQTYALLQSSTSNGQAASGAATVPINQTNAIMIGDVVSDTPDIAIYQNDFTTMLGAGASLARDAVPATSTDPLRWGGNWAGGGSSDVTGYLPLLACWDQRLTTAQREAEQANMEAYFGGTFPL